MNLRKSGISILAIIIRIMIVIVGLVFIYRLAFSAYDFGYRIFSEPPMSSGSGVDVTVTVPIGSSASDIGEILENAGLINDGRLFSWQERLSSWHGKLSPGTYVLNTSMTAEEIMEKMVPSENEEEEEAAD